MPLRRLLRAGRRWNVVPADEAGPASCDGLLRGRPERYVRALPVDAPAEVAYRWLCQLRAAPYSYDLVDNLGRRSPQTLTPGLERLAVGQVVTTIFRVVAFVPGRSITLRTTAGGEPVGGCVCTYAVRPTGPASCRIVVTMLLRVPAPGGRTGGPLPRLLGAAFGLGDLVMMRRQLLNLARLAEGTAARGEAVAATPPARVGA